MDRIQSRLIAYRLDARIQCYGACANAYISLGARVLLARRLTARIRCYETYAVAITSLFAPVQLAHRTPAWI